MTPAPEMRAAVLAAPKRMEVRRVPRPQLAAGEVAVRPTAVGLCGTDFHIFSGDANYHRDAQGRAVPLERAPQILGHEIAGVVEELGAGVGDLRIGDRVVVDQGRNCVSRARTPLCEYCATGVSHQCEEYAEHGITGLPGGLAERLAIPAVNVVRIASAIADERAALVEPLACVLHSLEQIDRAAARYQLRETDRARRIRTCLVFGGGPAGLLFAQALRHVAGFEGTLLVAEPDPHKRAIAATFGAEPLDPRDPNFLSEVAARTDGRLAEFVLDASGAGAVFPQIPGVLRKQGTLVLYGHGHAGLGLEALNAVQFREPCLVSPAGASGGFDADGRPSVYRRALGLLESGAIDVAPLVTHRYRGLDAAPGAFGGAHREQGYVKGVVLLG